MINHYQQIQLIQTKPDFKKVLTRQSKGKNVSYICYFQIKEKDQNKQHLSKYCWLCDKQLETQFVEKNELVESLRGNL